MNKGKKTGRIGIIITIVVLIALVAFSNENGNGLDFASNAFNKVIMPIQKIFTSIGNNFNHSESFDNLRSQNDKLTSQIAELQEQVRELEVIKAENENLKEYVNLKNKFSEYNSIPAYVINRDITNFNDVVTINLGRKDGVVENMTVVADQGLVGHIISVTDNTAQVQTIIDTASSLSCQKSSTGDNIIARGTLEKTNSMKATFIPTSAQVLQGDSIITSGIGGIYPRGITIGTVSKVNETQNITDRYAIIDTAVDFTKLNTVLVLTGAVNNE